MTLCVGTLHRQDHLDFFVEENIDLDSIFSLNAQNSYLVFENVVNSAIVVHILIFEVYRAF